MSEEEIYQKKLAAAKARGYTRVDQLALSPQALAEDPVIQAKREQVLHEWNSRMEELEAKPDQNTPEARKTLREWKREEENKIDAALVPMAARLEQRLKTIGDIQR